MISSKSLASLQTRADSSFRALNFPDKEEEGATNSWTMWGMAPAAAIVGSQLESWDPSFVSTHSASSHSDMPAAE